MKLEQFEKILNEFRKGHNMISELYDIGFNLLDGKYNLSFHLEQLFESSLKTHYTEDGIDWVTWFMFESDWGEKNWGDIPLYRKNENGAMVLDTETQRYGATDENGEPICYDIKSLWEYIEKNHKLQK